MQESHVWDEKLDVGDERIDRDHHLQIALVSALADALEQTRPLMARRLAQQLVGYSLAHFSGEELLMEDLADPMLHSHRREHEALLGRIEELRTILEAGESELALATTLELRTALGAHMASCDRLLAQRTASGARDRPAAG